jgi:uncharacterized glyoxalase superfamily protein PhnB
MNDSASQTIFPVLRYRDAAGAIDWLQRAFGFEEKELYRNDDGKVQHAELRLGSGIVMLGEHYEGGWFGDSPPEAAATSAGIYVRVDDPDAHCERARAAGAEIMRGPEDQPYGAREYSVRDLEGNPWSFGTYDPNG